MTTTTTTTTRIWNAWREPLPPGTPIHFIAPDGTVLKGPVSRNQVIRIRSMPVLGRQYRALVHFEGREVVPPLIALADDREGLAALHQVAQEVLA
jgi:hypothetical protein